MSKVASVGQTWKEALLSTLPERKGAREIGEDDDDDDLNSSQENSQDGSDNENGDSDNTSQKEPKEEKTDSIIPNDNGHSCEIESENAINLDSSDILKQ